MGHGACGRGGEGENAQFVLVVKTSGRPRHKYKHNFKPDVR